MELQILSGANIRQLMNYHCKRVQPEEGKYLAIVVLEVLRDYCVLLP